jgi:hypothetical protein
LGDQLFYFALGGRLGELVAEGLDAGLGAGLALAAHVGLRGDVVADQHGGQAGALLAGLQPRGYRLTHLGPNLRRNRGSIDDVCSHASSYGKRTAGHPPGDKNSGHYGLSGPMSIVTNVIA